MPLGLVAGLLVSEGLLRAVAPQWSDAWKMWRMDPVYARGLRPDVRDAVVHGHSGEFAFRFSTNRQGLRMDREVSLEPAPGTRRILLVGDSFTFGYGVDQGETFADVLQASAHRTGQPVEVVNAGFASGFTLDTEYLFTREVGAHWLPRDVVVGVCLSNDLADLALTRWRMAGERLIAIEKGNDWVPVWVKRSGLVNLVVKGVVPRLRADGPGNGEAAGARQSPCVLPAPRAATRAAGSAAPESRNPPVKAVAALSPAERAAWVMQAWSRHASASGYALTLLLIPDAEEVQWPTRSDLLASRARVREVFADAAGRAGVRILDPVAAMRAHVCSGEEPLYFDSDGHWNAAGHRFVGEWLASELLERDSRVPLRGATFGVETPIQEDRLSKPVGVGVVGFEPTTRIPQRSGSGR